MKKLPLLKRLFEPLPQTSDETGHYDETTQTWSERSPIKFSPVKHNQEE